MTSSSVLSDTQAREIARGELKDAALAFVREHGYEGDDLPCGTTSGYSCPVGRALGAKYAYRNLAQLPSGDEILFPRRVVEFVGAFDRGEFPELLERASSLGKDGKA